MDNADYLIVGGGSAGATLASRLSEDPSIRVLLVEAGRDTPPDDVPADIADTFPSSSLNPDYFWTGLQARRTPGGTLYPFPQARVMGGGSSVMGLWALRGMPTDFNSWAERGAQGWSWSDVLPYFRKLEDDRDRDASQSSPRPYTIRRIARTEWPAFAHAIERVVTARGLATIDDINERPGEGFFPMPVSQSEDDVRSSSASRYLTASVRSRANLAILARACTVGVEFDGMRASGVIVEHAGERRRLSAREVIVCAGAIHSPALLLRAGIGPAADLQRVGITPRVDRPGVGRNLQNHPYLHFALTLPRGTRLPSHLRRFAVAGIRLSSGHADAPPADLLVFAIGRVSPHPYGPDLAMVGAALYTPYSRGSVTLVSPDAHVLPQIDFQMLQDPRDPPRLLKAARFAESLLLDPSVAATYNDAFLLPPVMSLNQFNRPGLAGALIAGAAKALLNGPATVSRTVLDRMLRPGRWITNRHHPSSLTDGEILGAAAPMAHVVATCSMGRPDDPMTVVDPACRVIGVENLRVVDASIMPSVPSANTNLPTIMVAERAADLIRAKA